MKKFFLTTTALIATASYAAAEVSVTGSAEIGMDKKNKDSTLTFHQDINVAFKLTTKTDNGLGITTSVNLDEASNISGSPYDDQGFEIKISGGFGNLALGDTDGALDWAITEGHSYNPGSIASNETTLVGYESNGLDGEYDGQILRYDNNFGLVKAALSTEAVDNTKTEPTTVGSIADKGYGFGAGIQVPAGPVTVGVGYQTAQKQLLGEADTASDTAATAILKRKYDLTALSVKGEFSGLKGTLAFIRGNLGKYTRDADTTTANNQSAFEKEGFKQTQLGIGYALDAVSFGAHTFTGKKGSEKQTGSGFSASYSLGGGVKAKFGANNKSSYSLGLSMSF